MVPLAAGDISFDGRSIHLFDTDSISRLISYVPSSPAGVQAHTQACAHTLASLTPAVLAASIASNIAFSRDTASQAQVERAAVAVGADAWIRCDDV